MKITGIDQHVVRASAITAAIAAEQQLARPSAERLSRLRAQYQSLAEAITAEAVRQHQARIGLTAHAA